MKETEEIMGMIKEEGAAYFARERGNKVEVGLYLEHIIESDRFHYFTLFQYCIQTVHRLDAHAV